MTKTPQIAALPGVTPLGLSKTISFQDRSGAKVKGVVVADYGHALLIRVTASNRKNLRGRTQLFPKNDMGTTEASDATLQTLRDHTGRHS